MNTAQYLFNLAENLKKKKEEEEKKKKENWDKTMSGLKTIGSNIVEKNAPIKKLVETGKNMSDAFTFTKVEEKTVIPGSISDMAQRQRKLKEEGYFEEEDDTVDIQSKFDEALQQSASKRIEEAKKQIEWGKAKSGSAPTSESASETTATTDTTQWGKAKAGISQIIGPKEKYVEDNLKELWGVNNPNRSIIEEPTYSKLKELYPEAVKSLEANYDEQEQEKIAPIDYILKNGHKEMLPMNAELQINKTPEEKKAYVQMLKENYPEKVQKLEDEYSRKNKTYQNVQTEIRTMTPEEKTKLQQTQAIEQQETEKQNQVEKEKWVRERLGVVGMSNAPYSSIKEVAKDNVAKLEAQYDKEKFKANFLSNVDRAFTQSLKDIFGEEKISDMETSSAISPDRMMNRFLSAMTLDIVPFQKLQNVGADVYFEDGQMKYNGITIGEEFTTEEGKTVAAGADIAASLLGGFLPYAGISSGIKIGLAKLAESSIPKVAKLAKGAIEVSEKFPILSEITGYNIAEEFADMAIRKATGQDYTFNNFLQGIAMGAVLGGTLQVGTKLISSGKLSEISTKINDVLNITKDVETVKSIKLDDFTLGNVFKEQRLAFLNRPKTNLNNKLTSLNPTKAETLRPGIDTPAELPTETLNKAGKSPFRSGQIREITVEEKPVLETIKSIIKGDIQEAEIGKMPDFVSLDGKERSLILSNKITTKTINDHGKNMSAENLLINAKDWDYVIRSVNKNPDKINLIKEIPDSDSYLLIGANRVNGYFTLTHYEVKPKNNNELKNLLEKGDSLDRSGRTPSSFDDSLHVNPSSEGRSSLGRLSGVEPINKDTIPSLTKEVKDGDISNGQSDVSGRGIKDSEAYLKHKELEAEIDRANFKEGIEKQPKTPEEAKEVYAKYNDATSDVPEFPFKPDAYALFEKLPMMKDISGFAGQARDVYRNFEAVFGKKYFAMAKKEFLDPFDEAKGKYIDQQKDLLEETDKYIVKELGIKKGSKESEAVMNYGERFTDENYKNWDENYLKEKFGEEKAKNIIEADRWFRSKYDAFVEIANAVTKEIYPRSPEKLIPKRKDYYRHYQELSGVGGLINIFDTPANISSALSGISEFTKPKSKYLSFAQKRLGFNSERDAVGGFVNYIPSLAYRVNIDPQIGKFRALSKEIAIATEKNPNLNNFREFIEDWCNDLSGKTNPMDRFIQKVIGRKTFKVINWVNNRVKANQILGNLSSSVSQAFNIPQSIGATKQHSVLGLFRTVGQIWEKDPAINKSIFIKERYAASLYDKFDSKILDQPKKAAVWITGILDEVSSKFIWNSHYEKALKEGIGDPVKYADGETRKLVAGRGVGEVPLLQKSQITKIVAPFQLEVGNAWWIMKDMVSNKQFGSLVGFMATSYLMNRMAEQIRGNDVVFDPIQAVVDGVKTIQKNNITDFSRIMLIMGGRMAGEIFSNVPGGQTIASNIYPEYGAYGLPARSVLFGGADPSRFAGGLVGSKALSDPLFMLLPGYAGAQLKKTSKTVESLIDGGEVKSKSGKTVNFKIDLSDKLSVAKALLFGQYASDEGREYLMQAQDKLMRGWLTTEEKEAEKETKKKKKTTSSGMFDTKKTGSNTGMFTSKTKSKVNSSGMFQ